MHGLAESHEQLNPALNACWSVPHAMDGAGSGAAAWWPGVRPLSKHYAGMRMYYQPLQQQHLSLLASATPGEAAFGTRQRCDSASARWLAPPFRHSSVCIASAVRDTCTALSDADVRARVRAGTGCATWSGSRPMRLSSSARFFFWSSYHLRLEPEPSAPSGSACRKAVRSCLEVHLP